MDATRKGAAIQPDLRGAGGGGTGQDTDWMGRDPPPRPHHTFPGHYHPRKATLAWWSSRGELTKPSTINKSPQGAWQSSNKGMRPRWDGVSIRSKWEPTVRGCAVPPWAPTDLGHQQRFTRNVYGWGGSAGCSFKERRCERSCLCRR